MAEAPSTGQRDGALRTSVVHVENLTKIYGDGQLRVAT